MGLSHESFNFFCISDIEHFGEYSPSACRNISRSGGKFLIEHVTQCDVGSKVGESQCRCPPDTTGRSGDHRNPSGEQDLTWFHDVFVAQRDGNAQTS